MWQKLRQNFLFGELNPAPQRLCEKVLPFESAFETLTTNANQDGRMLHRNVFFVEI